MEFIKQLNQMLDKKGFRQRCTCYIASDTSLLIAASGGILITCDAKSSGAEISCGGTVAYISDPNTEVTLKACFNVINTLISGC